MTGESISGGTADVNAVRRFCDETYRAYNRPEYVHPDPLELVRGYDNPADREIAALICSSLALGRVELILGACRSVLGAFGSLREELEQTSFRDLQSRFDRFVYRFFKRDEIAGFLYAIGRTLREDGSLERSFHRGRSAGEETYLPALCRFRERLLTRCPADPGMLLPDPARGGATKRLHLFLRWLVRSDGVDTGDWRSGDPARLLIPLDVHMHRIARLLGATRRKGIDAKTAMEVTRFFRMVAPGDPVKYDFSLTRFGIHPQLKSEFARVEQAGKICYA